MSTRYSPERMTIGNLLSMTNPPIEVPYWQRTFRWTTSEVETFWQDLLNFDRRYPGNNVSGQEYFLGSVVIVDNNASHLLLDGQQRLATSAILLSVIRDYLGQFSRDAATRVSTRYLTDYDDAAESNTFKLTLNRYDRDFFRREVLEARDARYAPPTPTLESHQLIRKAREFFITKFGLAYQEFETPKEAHFWALRILRVLTKHISVVAVISDDEDNAANVFETLNDRGIGLSTPDLLRNLILRRAAEENQDEIIDLWGEVLEIEGDVKLKTFIRHYWISNEGDVRTQGLYREIKDNIISNEVNSLEFSRTLRDASLDYRDILAAQDQDEGISQTLQDINDLNATLLYPAVLSAYQVAEKDEELRSLLRALLVTFVRHNVIGRLENSLLENVVFPLARNLRAEGDFTSAIQSLRDFSPDDEIFVSAFQTVSISRQATARYILREIEMSLRRTEELDVSTPSRVHVEHIYPKTPLPGERLGNHSQIVNRLGNLTLLSRRLNTAIKNSPFPDKKPSYEKSELLLTQELLKYEEWTPDTIEQRQVELSDNVATIWAFPEI